MHRQSSAILVAFVALLEAIHRSNARLLPRLPGYSATT
jgi:hypothetical protein